MSLIDSFRVRLQQINSEALHLPFANLSEEMAKTAGRLCKKYGDITQGTADSRGIAIAVINYLATRRLSSYRDTKLVCFGISSEYGTPLRRIIEQESLFIYLLITVKQLQPEPRKFRRCYQGLLKAYLRYPGQQTEHAIGRKNWLALRDFLALHGTTLNQQHPVLEWTQALYEHRNLLAENPCEPYGKALLAGDNAIVDELKTRLGIDDDTWVMNELVLAQVLAATRLDDTEFAGKVGQLVPFLERHTGLVCQGLTLLLKRYADCQARPEHAVLRDAALKLWKSPWLEANKPIWHGQIGEHATNMVSLWLKKHSIREFFQLLQANGQADRQRMDFWLNYAEKIDEIWLALGRESISSTRSDYIRIRRNMADRYMALEGRGYSKDNAFMMIIGGYMFIEFGKSGNACHVFDANSLPFIRGQRSVLGTQDGLKNTRHPGHRKMLSHREGWQSEFAEYLGRVQASNPNIAINITAAAHNQIQEKKSFDYELLEDYCKSYELPIDDKRHRGGCLWVQAPENHIANDQLKSMGFRYKADKGWWHA